MVDIEYNMEVMAITSSEAEYFLDYKSSIYDILAVIEDEAGGGCRTVCLDD